MPYKTLEELDRQYFTKAQLEEIRAEAHQEIKALRLQELRELLHKRQVDVAARTGRTQVTLSQLERRSDIKLSTLRDYIESGLGLNLVVCAVDDQGRRYDLMAREDDETARKNTRRPAAGRGGRTATGTRESTARRHPRS